MMFSWQVSGPKDHLIHKAITSCHINSYCWWNNFLHQLIGSLSMVITLFTGFCTSLQDFFHQHQVIPLGYKDCAVSESTWPKQVSEANQKESTFAQLSNIPRWKTCVFFPKSMSIWFPLMWSYPCDIMWYSRIGFNCIIQPLEATLGRFRESTLIISYARVVVKRWTRGRSILDNFGWSFDN